MVLCFIIFIIYKVIDFCEGNICKSYLFEIISYRDLDIYWSYLEGYLN